MKKKWIGWLLCGAIVFCGALIYNQYNGLQAELPEEVRAHHLFSVFEERFEYRPVMGAAKDLDGDGKEDLLVVFSYTKDSNKIVAILDGDEPVVTEMEPAPLENVTIEFKDIDKTPPVEFILSGSKGSNFGYGIYRIQDEAIFNIFGADMEDCC